MKQDTVAAQDAAEIGVDAPEAGYGLIADIPVRLSVEVGSAPLQLAELLSLGEGSVVELDRQADDLLDIMANGKLIARGEVVTIGTRYGVRLVEVASGDARGPGLERRR